MGATVGNEIELTLYDRIIIFLKNEKNKNEEIYNDEVTKLKKAISDKNLYGNTSTRNICMGEILLREEVVRNLNIYINKIEKDFTKTDDSLIKEFINEEIEGWKDDIVSISTLSYRFINRVDIEYSNEMLKILKRFH